MEFYYMKNSFGLLLTLFLLTLFAFLSIFIIETKTLSSNINSTKYLQTGAKLKLNFAKELILDLNITQITKSLTLEDDKFDINATFNHLNNKAAIVDIFISPKFDSNIRLHHRFTKKLQ